MVAEVGTTSETDQLYRLTFDGSVGDEHGFVAMGGSAEAITTELSERWSGGLSLEESVRLATDILGRHGGEQQRTLTPGQLEVAVLDRSRPRRTFQRITGDRLAHILGVPDDEADSAGAP